MVLKLAIVIHDEQTGQFHHMTSGERLLWWGHRWPPGTVDPFSGGGGCSPLIGQDSSEWTQVAPGVMKWPGTQHQEAWGEGPKPLPKVRSGSRLLGLLAWCLLISVLI